MIANDPDDMVSDVKDVLSDYFILSQESGPIKNSSELNAQELVQGFYGALFVAKNEFDNSDFSISTYSELAKRLNVSKGSVKKAHQRLRDRGIIKKADTKLGHKITDGGLQKLLEDFKDE